MQGTPPVLSNIHSRYESSVMAIAIACARARARVGPRSHFLQCKQLRLSTTFIFSIRFPF